ncbi:hypothetical protein FC093_10645 [Ilyomonas limi]|uniref:Bacterial Pleckstrin homology domain-containing protein n=1 Tax=Ilyomonas limi TaxID=2575867 RepID=A0A4U3L1C4_9BACT|nr:PH domain-containing protein [Ilyomonas limi]TKK68572.1 hypothetical protein FC093_10645 [Ilyomonas limi]
MLFKISLDKTAIAITVLFTLSFACIIATEYLIASDVNIVRPLCVTVIFLLLYGLAFAFHPTAYKVTPDALIICRLIRNVRIKHTTIKSIAIVDKKEINGAIRTFGVGGVFGYYGCFANYTLSSMTWYATRRDKAVLITTTYNKKIVVTPNEPADFIAALSV